MTYDLIIFMYLFYKRKYVQLREEITVQGKGYVGIKEVK